MLANEAKNRAKQMEVSDNPPMELSRKRVTNPPNDRNLEHHVASLITTMAI